MTVDGQGRLTFLIGNQELVSFWPNGDLTIFGNFTAAEL